MRRLSMWQRVRGTPDMATCREVGRVLQTYLDGELDSLKARRVARHLEMCRRCGMEAETYSEIKQSLRRRHAGPAVDVDSLARLRAFAERLVDEPDPDPGEDDGGEGSATPGR